MEQQRPPGRSCPACGNKDYSFRSRRQIEADPATGEGPQIETKYRCKACNEEWKEKVRGLLQKAPPPPK
jgi:DNA-directed RNA polymerase subunit M/transcription elongation factor TFIIS